MYSNVFRFSCCLFYACPSCPSVTPSPTPNIRPEPDPQKQSLQLLPNDRSMLLMPASAQGKVERGESALSASAKKRKTTRKQDRPRRNFLRPCSSHKPPKKHIPTVSHRLSCKLEVTQTKPLTYSLSIKSVMEIKGKPTHTQKTPSCAEDHPNRNADGKKRNFQNACTGSITIQTRIRMIIHSKGHCRQPPSKSKGAVVAFLGLEEGH